MAVMDSIFNKGFGSQFNTANWARMPTQSTMQGMPPAQPTAPPVAGEGIRSVADYNTMVPLAGGTPAAAPLSPVQNRINSGGLLGAILAQFRNQGLVR